MTPGSPEVVTVAKAALTDSFAIASESGPSSEPLEGRRLEFSLGTPKHFRDACGPEGPSSSGQGTLG